MNYNTIELSTIAYGHSLGLIDFDDMEDGLEAELLDYLEDSYHDLLDDDITSLTSLSIDGYKIGGY